MAIRDLIERADKREELIEGLIGDFSQGWVGTIQELKQAVRMYEKIYSNKKILKVSVSQKINEIICDQYIKFGLDIYDLNYIKVHFDFIEAKRKKNDSIIKISKIERADRISPK